MMQFIEKVKKILIQLYSKACLYLVLNLKKKMKGVLVAVQSFLLNKAKTDCVANLKFDHSEHQSHHPWI